MSYVFGWWDFVEVDGEQQMVCRDSDERVVMVRDLEKPWLAKACAEHPKRPADRWKRFEYRHAEFWFPLIVNWVPDEGRILVDYNLSSELWRLETNADTEYPPYGGWVRVDDMVPDAFWCWPGILEVIRKNTSKEKDSNNITDWKPVDHLKYSENLIPTQSEKIAKYCENIDRTNVLKGIEVCGGWSNNNWCFDIQRLEYIGPDFTRVSPFTPYGMWFDSIHNCENFTQTEEIAVGTEFNYGSSSCIGHKLYEDWEDITPIPELTLSSFRSEFDKRRQYERSLIESPLLNSSQIAWQFKIGNPVEDFNSSSNSQFSNIKWDIRKSLLVNSDTMYLISKNLDRAITYHSIEFGVHRFQYNDSKNSIKINVLISPLIDWIYSFSGFYFSYKSHKRDGIYQRTNPGSIEISLQDANRILRNCVDAFLLWRGSGGIESGWTRLELSDYQYNQSVITNILKPITSISSIKSHLAGKRVKDRCNVTKYELR